MSFLTFYYFKELLFMTAPAGIIPLVVDCGSATVKAGFGAEESPRVEFATITGTVRHPGLSGTALGSKVDTYVGDAAEASRGLLSTTNPVFRGHVVDWKSMEAVWHHTFIRALSVAPDDHPVLMAETPDTTRLDREKVATAMFEGLNVPALVCANSAVLALFSTGRSTGIVLESGAEKTLVSPIWEGYCLPHYVRRINFGGTDVTYLLREKFRQEGYPFSTFQDMLHLKQLKEELCYTAADAAKELSFSRESHSLERYFNLPDGSQIFVNENRFLIPEVLLNPERDLDGVSTDALKQSRGWHKVVQESIHCCDSFIRPEMYSNVVLAGGNTLFQHLDERIQRDVSLLAPKGVLCKVVAFNNRKYAVWLGGSIMASMSTFPAMWISKSEYDDYGASIVHRKA